MTDEAILRETARRMVAPPRGILAVDESNATCTKRFNEFGIESTPDSRRAYREMMFTAPGIADYVSGAILYDETIRQTASDGRSMVRVLDDAGILPGIKVDMGTKPLAKAPGELITEGLDGLRDRLNEYREIGATFTKWRAVIKIGPEIPSGYCIDANAHALGRYAALAQEAGLVPIVEPEVLMDGSHDIERCREVTTAVLTSVFRELKAQRVEFDQMVLKPNMVVAGMDCVEQPGPEAVADATLETLRRCVPEAVPGIAFLSGGMSGEESCANLDAMVRKGPHPWELTYSFGRALQYPGLEIWDGKEENVPQAQEALLHRARMSSNARSGKYSREEERAFVAR